MTTFSGRSRILIIGGPDVHLRIPFVRRLQSQHDVSIAGSGLDTAAASEIRAAGISYFPYILKRHFSPLGDLVTVLLLARLIRRHRPVIVHTFDTKPAVLGRLAARIARTPVIIGTITGLGTLYMQDDRRTRLIRALYEPLQKAACRQSDMTTFYNHQDANTFVSRGIAPADKVRVIPGSGILIERFSKERVPAAQRQALRTALDINDGDILITMIARLVRSKGVLHFATAAKRIRQQYPEARFLLIGPRDPRSLDSLSAAELRSLSPTVTWLGPRRDIPALLSISDIFVLPSQREGVPRVLVEAAAMGLPAVASDVPGSRDVIQHEQTGLLVPFGNETALVQSIERLINNPGLRERLGHSAFQRARERFSLEAIAMQVASLYDELLAAKGLFSLESAARTL